MQETFAGWLAARVDADLDALEAELQAEADERQSPIDYEELDHASDQARWSCEEIERSWN